MTKNNRRLILKTKALFFAIFTLSQAHANIWRPPPPVRIPNVDLITVSASKARAKTAVTGLQVMKKVDENNKKLKTMSSEVLMTIVRGKDKRERNFYHLKKYKDGMSKSLIKFYLPSTVKGTALLTHSQDDEDSKTQWIYLPALKALTQITGDRENESFMGSDFSYSDVAGRQLGQDKHSLIKESSSHYRVQSVPKNKEDIYSKIILNISKKTFVPQSIIFYGKDGKKMKELKNNRVQKFDSAYVVVDAVMKNHKSQGETRLIVSEVEPNVPISDKSVGIKGLRK